MAGVLRTSLFQQLTPCAFQRRAGAGILVALDASAVVVTTGGVVLASDHRDTPEVVGATFDPGQLYQVKIDNTRATPWRSGPAVPL